MSRLRASFSLPPLLLALVTACQGGGLEQQRREDSMLNRLVEEYNSRRVRFYPVEATLRGHHALDGELGDFGRRAVQQRRIWLRDFHQRLLGIDVTRLSRPAYLDLFLLTSAVKAEDYELTHVESWKHSPAYYTKAIRIGLCSLLLRGSITDAQIRSLVSRLARIPPFLDQARDNLERSPRLLVEEALSDLRWCRRWVEELPALIGEGSSSRNLSELGVKSRQAVRALQSFEAYLETGVLPQATATFALGSAKLSRLLLYQEMEDEPLGELRAEAGLAVGRARSKMEEIVSLMQGSASPTEVLRRLGADQPPASELISLAEQTIETVRAFAEERRLTSVALDRPVRIIETPPYLRAMGRMILPTFDPLGNDSRGTVLMLTLLRPEWPAPRLGGDLRQFSRRGLQTAIIRELYPGKSLYDGALRKSKSRLRQLDGSRAHREGWGLYVEERLLAEGYRWEDPLLQMVQLQDELIEQCRLMAAVDLHAGAKSLDEVARLFRDKAYLDPERARRQARAVAINPKLWSAALGKLQILKLRESYLRTNATPGALSRFHDTLLESAGLPLKLVAIEQHR